MKSKNKPPRQQARPAPINLKKLKAKGPVQVKEPRDCTGMEPIVATFVLLPALKHGVKNLVVEVTEEEAAAVHRLVYSKPGKLPPLVEAVMGKVCRAWLVGKY